MNAIIRRTALAACLITGMALQHQAQTPKLSPAEQRIAAAQKAIAAKPSYYEAYNELAMALASRARETSDPAYYDRADEAARKALAISPNNYAARKAQAWILLGKHEFAKARDLARVLNKEVPDDVQVYGYLTDANAELGDYAEAEKAAQWMLDLRPGNLAGLTRTAYLRELFGDMDGAVEAMEMAYRRLPASETEERAWILTQVAHLRLQRGKPDQAAVLLDQALKLFPNYHYALGGLADVRRAQGHLAEAADLQRQRYQAAPHPENLYSLAQALAQAGRKEEAKQAFTEFERKGLAESQSADNSNRELIYYFADVARRPDEALRLAKLEHSRRQDVYTLAAYAWALHRTGAHAAARAEVDKALAVGIQDADILYRAGTIAQSLKDRAAAQRYFRQSLDVNPVSLSAAAARRALSSLRKIPGGTGVKAAAAR